MIDFVRFYLRAFKTIRHFFRKLFIFVWLILDLLCNVFILFLINLFIFVQIKEDCKSLLLSNEQLTTLMEDMDKAIRNGLGKETNPTSIVKCYVTYVQDLPNGTGKLKTKKYCLYWLQLTNILWVFLISRKRQILSFRFGRYQLPCIVDWTGREQLFPHGLWDIQSAWTYPDWQRLWSN